MADCAPFPLAVAVWTKLAVPKHSFVMWLMVQDRLLTRDKLERWNLAISNVGCPLCEAASESHTHLFFCCEYSRMIMTRICDWVGIRRMPYQRGRWLHWIRHLSGGKSLKHCVWLAAIQAGIYHIWRSRNKRIHGEPLIATELVLLRVKQEVRARLLMAQREKLSNADQAFLTLLLV